jgi:hypothetical protein
MNYTIITQEQKLKEFIDWLPVLQPDEKYYLCLFARNKYCKELTHIKSDKAQLKRFVSDKERMLGKIRQLEVAYGAYTQKELIVPQEALALYITVNPRNMFKASINTMVKLATSIRDTNVTMNPHQEALSEIQKAKSRTCYIDFDIDENDAVVLQETIEKVKTYINEDAITWLRTRGGLHVLVDPTKVEKQYKSSFWKNMVALPNSDQSGDQMIPVPGTYQGGSTPYFLKQ